jgi:hypothetical protein
VKTKAEQDANAERIAKENQAAVDAQARLKVDGSIVADARGTLYVMSGGLAHAVPDLPTLAVALDTSDPTARVTKALASPVADGLIASWAANTTPLATVLVENASFSVAGVPCLWRAGQFHEVLGSADDRKAAGYDPLAAKPLSADTVAGLAPPLGAPIVPSPGDGRVVADDRGTRYWMQDGRARLMPDPISLAKATDKPTGVMTLWVGAGVVADIAPWLGEPYPTVLVEGAFFRNASTGTAYVWSEGTLRKLPTDPATLAAWAYTRELATPVEGGAIEAVPKGSDIARGAPAPTPGGGGGTTPGPPNGTFLTAPTGEFYRVSGGKAHKIPDTVTLEVLGGAAADEIPMVAASGEDLARWSVGADPYKTAIVEGRLFMDFVDNTLYVIGGGRRHAIPNLATLTAIGGSLEGSVKLSSATIGTIPLGDPVPAYIAPTTTTTPGYVPTTGTVTYGGGGGGGYATGRNFLDVDATVPSTIPGVPFTTEAELPPMAIQAGMFDFFKKDPLIVITALSAVGGAIAWYMQWSEAHNKAAAIPGAGPASAVAGYGRRRRGGR